ncbi:pyridoxal phosphate phosphatase PHOSPHO2 isoform X2 [Boleophthalmus pectinirostris]|uniref:pyridoxal phosphate phosphatase PHOSPHO2 isoform X2 n=1 Tax=Boleophthalmus pectinirostris TaxID=150288 RepID=UPI00242DE5FE|nr:pyridoxal phosphate phosphatase PHOSPHO2 isoform X2 [Boleophthalmus pectinirostris]
MKTLMVFDFDHTVVDDNSDTWVIRCLPGGTLPDSVKNSYRKGHWTEYMGNVLKYIGEQNVTPDQIRSELETIPFTDGMKELLTYISLHKNSIDCIVISDSNTLFIEWILHGSRLQSAVDQVFTNPAHINEQGYMEMDVSLVRMPCLRISSLVKHHHAIFKFTSIAIFSHLRLTRF